MKPLVTSNGTNEKDWYRDADPEDRREYDEFGPWIFSVRSEEDMPRRFRPWYSAQKGARYLLKVPREVDRREVRPGDDLYRMVLGVHEDRLCCLTLADGQISEENIPTREIEAIRHSEALLLGQLTLWLQGGREWNLSYNTVSTPEVVPIVDFLRRCISVPSPVPKVTPLLVEDYFFSALVAEHLRRNPENRVVFCEAPQPIAGSGEHRPRYTTGLLVLDSGAELSFLTQGTESLKGGKVHFGFHCLHMPRRFLKGVEIRDRLEKGVFAGHDLELRGAERVADFSLAGDGTELANYLKRL